jgi:nucleotide-binding universal stress UspA family protein
VVTRIRVGNPAAEIASEAALRKPELIVMGRGGQKVRDFFVGSTAERVIRRSQRPVLVVRRPARDPYQRPLLALDLDRAARSVLATSFRILPLPRPRLGIVHAYDIPYYGLTYASLSPDRAAAYRRDQREAVLRELNLLLRPSRGSAPEWAPYVRHGSPRTVIPETVAQTDADLLVLGTRANTGLAHVLLGTVAGDVLRSVPCDVLVVPPKRNVSR